PSLRAREERNPADIADSPDVVASQTQPRSVLHRIFIGPHGLRAGWKVPVFLLILFAAGLCLRPLGKLAGEINPRLPVPTGTMLFRDFLRAIAVLLQTRIMAISLHHNPCLSFRLPLRIT